MNNLQIKSCHVHTPCHHPSSCLSKYLRIEYFLVLKKGLIFFFQKIKYNENRGHSTIHMYYVEYLFWPIAMLLPGYVPVPGVLDRVTLLHTEPSCFSSFFPFETFSIYFGMIIHIHGLAWQPTLKTSELRTVLVVSRKICRKEEIVFCFNNCAAKSENKFVLV